MHTLMILNEFLSTTLALIPMESLTQWVQKQGNEFFATFKVLFMLAAVVITVVKLVKSGGSIGSVLMVLFTCIVVYYFGFDGGMGVFSGMLKSQGES